MFTAGQQKKIKKLLLLFSFCYLVCVGYGKQSSSEVIHGKDTLDKILVVALDDRPVNIDYPLYLALDGEITISNSLRKESLTERIETIENELKTGEYNSLVLSFDNLLYGGLMESRVVENALNESEKQRIITLLTYMKENKITAYGFTSAQRVTTNIFSVEDTKRYNNSIVKNDLLTRGNFMSSAQTSFVLDEEDSSYYHHRANKVKDTVFLLQEAAEYFQQFYVAQDDTQPSGIQKFELHSLKKEAKSENIHFVNGTDEMIASFIYKIKYEGEKPKVFPYITSKEDFSRTILPFEGVTLEHILIEKQQMFDVHFVDLDRADYVWIIHNGKTFNQEEVYNLLQTNKTIMVTDLNISNVTHQLLSDLFQNNPQAISNIDVFCSWNTASNMIGLTLSQAFLSKHNPNNQLLLEKRILKDYLYHSKLKYEINQLFMEGIVDQYNFENPLVNEYIQSEMNEFLKNQLETSTRVEKVTFPWNRLFEISIELNKAIN